jgi:RND family efflux transporter MFP subunit
MITGHFVPLSPTLSAVVSIAGEIAWKAALLCLAAAIAHLMAGRRRVLLRSAVWHACLGGLLLLPVIVMCGPRMTVAILESQAALPRLLRSVPAVESPAQIRNAEQPVPASARVEAANRQVAVVPMATQSVAPALDNTDATPAPGMITVNLRNAAVTLISAVYFLVVVVHLARLVASLRSVAALRRSGILIAGPAWQSALERWCGNLQLRAPVALRQTDRVSVPVVIGSRRPLVLLPVELAQTADPQVIDAILLHELTHVARGDYAWNLVLRVVQAIYWPHPLVWLVGRMVRHVRETACDAVCIYWMQDVRAYCGILVDVADALAERPEVVLGMAMSRSSRLSRRLARIEGSPGSVRGLLSRGGRTTLALAASGAVGVMGAVQFVPRVSATEAAPAKLTAGAQSGDDVRHSIADTTRGRAVEVADELPGEGGPEKPASGKRGEKPEAAAGTNPRVDPDSTNEYLVTVQDQDESKQVKITTVKVKRGNVPKKISVAASVTAFEPVSIHARLAGVVSKVAVAEGDRVKKGDLLFELDVPDLDVERAKYEAALAQAEATAEQGGAALEAAEASAVAAEATIKEVEADGQRAAAARSLAKKQHERMQKLFEQKSIEERILDEHTEKLAAAEADSAATSARLQSAKASLNRTRAGIRLAEADIRTAKLRVAAAKADLKRSQTLESFREIRAPIDGVVLARQIEADTYLKPEDGRSLLTLARTNVMTAVISIAEYDAPLVKRGAPATITAPALENKPLFSGKVSRIAYGIDPNTHTVSAFITVANPDDLLKPGMFAHARIDAGEIADALFVPAWGGYKMIDNHKSRSSWFRVRDRRLVHTDVVTWHRNGVQVEILEGLQEGDEVVENPPGELRDGQAVEMIPPEKK